MPIRSRLELPRVDLVMIPYTSGPPPTDVHTRVLLESVARFATIRELRRSSFSAVQTTNGYPSSTACSFLLFCYFLGWVQAFLEQRTCFFGWKN